MEQIPVHAIFTSTNATSGTIASAKLVVSHIQEMFGDEKFQRFAYKIQTEPNVPFHFFNKFHQYIILVNYFPENPPAFKLTMKLTDFHGKIDNALDEYLKLQENDWAKESRDTIMKLYSEIEESHPERIPMVAVAPDIGELLGQ